MTFGTRYAKKLHLVTNETKRLTIDDGGSVGIGSVQQKLLMLMEILDRKLLYLDRHGHQQ